jgi:hypothetical protein
MRIIVLSVSCLLLAFTSSATAQSDQPAPAVTVQVMTPIEGDTLIGRRPEIQAQFAGTPPAELLVILDGTDITPLIEQTAIGFSFRPPRALPAGSHQLVVTTRDAAGVESQASVGFSSRHGKNLLEAASQNEIGYVYDVALATHQYPQGQLKQKLEGILRTESRVKTDHWQMGFSGGLRHIEQNPSPVAPLTRGIEATTWLLSLGYSRDQASAEARFGDIQLNETSYTVANLARRGGDITMSYDRLRLHLFNVAGQQYFGFRGGTGLGSDTNRHISGMAAGVKFFEDRLEVKGVFADGGEAGASYNIGTSTGGQKGSVVGGQINTDFFQGKLRSEMEYARTRYDANISDANGSINDNAWRIKLGGNLASYSYEGQYDYVGSGFTSIGNLSGIPRDREGAAIRSGVLLETHSITANVSRYADNVDDDTTRPRIVNYQGGIDYSFTGWPKVPLGISVQTGLQKSEKEPFGSSALELQTETLSGRIGFLAGDFRFQAVASGSRQNDRNSNNNDTTTATYQIVPVYMHDVTQISTTFQLMQTWRHDTERTDLLTTSLDLRSGWLDNRLTGELAGSYAVATRHGNNTTLMVNSRLGYNLPEYWGGVKSSLAVRGSYNHSNDRSPGALNRDELSAFMILATTIPAIW